MQFISLVHTHAVQNREVCMFNHQWVLTQDTMVLVHNNYGYSTTLQEYYTFVTVFDELSVFSIVCLQQLI